MPPNAIQLRGYADVLVRTALGLREGQGLLLRAELAHRDFANLVVEAAYDAGASLVVVDWQDQRVNRARYARSRPEYLDRVPAGLVAQYHQLMDEGWALLNLTGEELPKFGPRGPGGPGGGPEGHPRHGGEEAPK